MRVSLLAPVGLVCAASMLVGCNQQMNSMFQPPSNMATAQANAPAPLPVSASNSATAPVPYVLSAQSSGPYINFSIYNMGTTDLVVEKEDFAVIDPATRAVTPYDKAGAIIDLPQPAIVKPNDTLHGRAIFHGVQSPLSKRLVFKPDDVGTFADINRVPMISVPKPSPWPTEAPAAAPGAPAAPAQQVASAQ